MGLNGQDLKSRGKLKLTPTVSESLPSTGPMSSDMETFELSTGQLFPELTCSVAASPARISALPESEPELTGSVQGSGVNTSEPFAHFDPATSSWKTYQVCLLTSTWDVFSETWPRAGTMRNGIVYQQVPLAPLTGGIESGLWPTPRAQEPGATTVGYGRGLAELVEGKQQRWPTPTARDWRSQYAPNSQAFLQRMENKRGVNLVEELQRQGNIGQLNPQWVEWLMGYPIGWTDLEDSATPSSRKSRNGSDGKS